MNNGRVSDVLAQLQVGVTHFNLISNLWPDCADFKINFNIYVTDLLEYVRVCLLLLIRTQMNRFHIYAEF